MTDADKRSLSTVVVPGEGRAHLEACMAATFKHCRKYTVKTVVIYTATGEGPCFAIDQYLSKSEYAEISIVAVTPPVQRAYKADPRDPESETIRTGIRGDRRRKLNEAGVPVVSARLPFASVHPEGPTDPMQLVDRAFGVLGGGFSLCIQSALMACDAGAVPAGKRIAVMSADTSLVVLATYSESFTSLTHGLLVEHIICRPTLYDVSRPNHFITMRAKTPREDSGTTPLLEKGDEK